MNYFEILNAAAAIFTCAGVIFGGLQLWLSRIDNVSQFEDSFAKEYRDLINRWPANVLLGQKITDAENEKSFDEMIRYFDLCNEQIFLRQKDRVRSKTWGYWREGMSSNFSKPAIAWAWNHLTELNTVDYVELRKLIKSEFKLDPKEMK